MLHKLSEYVGISGLLSRVTPHMRLQLKGFALAFAGVAMQSCNYITAKIAMADPKRIEEGGFNPQTFAALWYITATVYGLALAGVMGQGRQLIVRGKDLWVMLGLGLSLTFSASFGWAALQIMDPTFSACLGRLVPVMVIVIGTILFKEHIRLPEWVAVAIMVCGGALSTLGGT